MTELLGNRNSVSPTSVSLDLSKSGMCGELGKEDGACCCSLGLRRELCWTEAKRGDTSVLYLSPAPEELSSPRDRSSLLASTLPLRGIGESSATSFVRYPKETPSEPLLRALQTRLAPKLLPHPFLTSFFVYSYQFVPPI